VNTLQVTEAAQVADRWTGYCEDLYHDEEGKGTEQRYWEPEPPPFRSEVDHAISQTASHKATDHDKIPAEQFKAGGDHARPRWTGLSVEESIRMTEDRDKWKKYVHDVANHRIEDG